MSEIHRYYKCGCCPDEEEFCPRGDEYVWMERGNLMLLADEHNTIPEAQLRYREGLGRGGMKEHLRLQDELGLYSDVPYPSEPPDDGYDEDPREVGYPS